VASRPSGVDIAIADRTLHALIGPTAPARHGVQSVVGPLPAGRGSVSLQPANRWTSRRRHRARRYRPLVPDHQSFSGARVGENIRLRAGTASAPLRSLTPALSIDAINAETDDIIRYLGLAGIEQAEAGILSYGGQRLLDMGVALATAPRVLLLDEPLAGLAAAERERIGAIISASRPMCRCCWSSMTSTGCFNSPTMSPS